MSESEPVVKVEKGTADSGRMGRRITEARTWRAAGAMVGVKLANEKSQNP